MRHGIIICPIGSSPVSRKYGEKKAWLGPEGAAVEKRALLYVAAAIIENIRCRKCRGASAHGKHVNIKYESEPAPIARQQGGTRACHRRRCCACVTSRAWRVVEINEWPSRNVELRWRSVSSSLAPHRSSRRYPQGSRRPRAESINSGELVARDVAARGGAVKRPRK